MHKTKWDGHHPDDPAENSEVALAEVFTRDNPHWRYCAKINRWYEWSTKVWELDNKKQGGLWLRSTKRWRTSFVPATRRS